MKLIRALGCALLILSPLPSHAATVTAYTSHVNQTDDSPCIAARNVDVCRLYAMGQLVCASNDYALGTLLTVDGYGTCRVLDRMNARYTGTGRVDVYMGYDLTRARAWGIRKVRVYKGWVL